MHSNNHLVFLVIINRGSHGEVTVHGPPQRSMVNRQIQNLRLMYVFFLWTHRRMQHFLVENSLEPQTETSPPVSFRLLNHFRDFSLADGPAYLLKSFVASSYLSFSSFSLISTVQLLFYCNSTMYPIS